MKSYFHTSVTRDDGMGSCNLYTQKRLSEGCRPGGSWQGRLAGGLSGFWFCLLCC